MANEDARESSSVGGALAIAATVSLTGLGVGFGTKAISDVVKGTGKVAKTIAGTNSNGGRKAVADVLSVATESYVKNATDAVDNILEKVPGKIEELKSKMPNLKNRPGKATRTKIRPNELPDPSVITIDPDDIRVY